MCLSLYSGQRVRCVVGEGRLTTTTAAGCQVRELRQNFARDGRGSWDLSASARIMLDGFTGLIGRFC